VSQPPNLIFATEIKLALCLKGDCSIMMTEELFIKNLHQLFIASTLNGSLSIVGVKGLKF